MIILNTKIILASASPRRKELLTRVVPHFEIIPADIDENIPLGIDAEDAAEFLAVRKAMGIDISDSLIIGCDTVVINENQILTKPKNKEDAFNMLRSLSGKTHRVITGVCLRYAKHTLSFCEKTAVEFFELSDDEINQYIATGEPMDKAGAYGIQGLGSLFVKSICGDFYNVVGLPIGMLKRKLQSFEMMIEH